MFEKRYLQNWSNIFHHNSSQKIFFRSTDSLKVKYFVEVLARGKKRDFIYFKKILKYNWSAVKYDWSTSEVRVKYEKVSSSTSELRTSEVFLFPPWLLVMYK